MYRAHCSLVGTVQHFFRIRYYKFSYICTLMFQSLIGTVQHNGKWAWYFLGSYRWVSISYRYGSTPREMTEVLLWQKVSISYRYGSTTVFTAFHVFIIPYFYRFSIFFSKKVGQPFHRKFPQSLDSTGFFIFVKIGSEVHRLFYRIFSNLLFECPPLNFYRKPKI